MTRRATAALILGPGLVVSLWVGCAGVPRPAAEPVPVPAPGELRWTIFLVGDAGAPKEGDPVLAALAAAASGVAGRGTIVYLGDNLYPLGLPDSTDPEYPELAARLDRQVAVSRASRLRALFIPGNHDWARGRAGGFARIRRQAEFIRERGEGRAELLPAGGCPGPEVEAAGGVFRLVLLDTQYWLLDGIGPAPEECPFGTDSLFVHALDQATPGDSLPTVVLGHHPLASGGVHGGRFNFGHHVFPLRELADWLWLPLPVIGSLYPAIRGSGVSPQDIPNTRNLQLRRMIERGFAGDPPLAYAAGHEHNLQVIRGTAAQWLLVSGSGYFGHGGPVGWRDSTHFASSAGGFMRLDATASGRVRLGVITVDKGGVAREAYSRWVQ